MNTVPPLPVKKDLETVVILKQLNKSSRALAELKGEAKTIPDESILINTLGLQEAKDSSEVENIITTHDELFRAGVDEHYKNLAAKEVQNYVAALKLGFSYVQNTGLLTNRSILEIQATLEKNNAGFRKLPGTKLKNNKGEVVYEPPQGSQEILDLMGNLDQYINDPDVQDLDPLIKMGIIHYQFESIHPFYDGNGRTGRIINILYLVKEGLLDIPVLYLSRYIIDHKSDYYRYLQSVRDSDAWEEWILYMLKGVEQTALATTTLIRSIRVIMDQYEEKLKTETSFYRKDLLEIIFRHPYTKIPFLENDLQIHRQTAATYLNELDKLQLLKKVKLGKSNYYLNTALFNLLKYREG
ncbi:Fic family protein [Cesiribacter sp. SM1]|uniref:Fic family protein n=1 Tax=Cesiribacter sp. SM1 TaxID=2861196 RepID=UPI001CD40123|nr:Fic/DOC family N-terminal domain-containing protein [Cesiribacter sp. SM1]